jgi:hypothetical protein
VAAAGWVAVAGSGRDWLAGCGWPGLWSSTAGQGRRTGDGLCVSAVGDFRR